MASCPRYDFYLKTINMRERWTMFNEEKLRELESVPDNKVCKGFSIYHYSVDDRSEGGAARNQLGYFPKGSMKPGDTVYISGDGVTTQHWVDVNQAEKKLSLQLFGG